MTSKLRAFVDENDPKRQHHIVVALITEVVRKGLEFHQGNPLPLIGLIAAEAEHQLTEQHKLASMPVAGVA